MASHGISRAITPVAIIASILTGNATADADDDDHEWSVAVVPFDMAASFASHPTYGDTSQESSVLGAGITAAYLKSISPSWEVGPRLTAMWPRIEGSWPITEVSALMTLRLTRAFASNTARFSIGLQSGFTVSSTVASGDRVAGVGLGLGPVIGLRLYMGSNLWLAIDGNADVILDINVFQVDLTDYRRDTIHLGMFGVGVAYRVRSEEKIASASLETQDLDAKGRTIAGFFEAHTIHSETLPTVPLFGMRYTRPLSASRRLALEMRVSTNILFSVAQAGVVYELVDGCFTPYGFARAGLMFGLEHDQETTAIGLAGLGLAITLPSRMYWFLEAGKGVTTWVHGIDPYSGVRDHFQASIGLGERR